MILRSTEIGEEGGHEAGKRLLTEMYEACFGEPVPPILVTERGKPFFENSKVYFSISHTKKHAFCVLSEKNVGIDAEEMDREISLKLAEKILSATEKEQFDAASDKREALLRFWVLKEADAKCKGTGLTGYPNGTAFSLDDPRVFTQDGCYVAVIETEQENRYAF